MGKEKTVILGLRCDPEWKELAKEEAESRGQTLSAFVWDLILAGFEKVCMEDGKDDV